MGNETMWCAIALGWLIPVSAGLRTQHKDWQLHLSMVGVLAVCGGRLKPGQHLTINIQPDLPTPAYYYTT
jgi:hypothetical protein